MAALPEHIQRQARQAHTHFLQNPDHPGLNFKPVKAAQSWWSVRIGKGYRAIGIREWDEIRWFWIGSHADYDQLLRGK